MTLLPIELMVNSMINKDLIQIKSISSAVVDPGGFSYLTGTPGNVFLVKATNEDQVYPALVTVENGKGDPLASEQSIEASTTSSWNIKELDPSGKVLVKNVSEEPVINRPSIIFTMTPV